MVEAATEASYPIGQMEWTYMKMAYDELADRPQVILEALKSRPNEFQVETKLL